ncbi:putative garp protein, possible [Cryptosporidium felis]|nr:putative garp protein, possible [Cryptosporidium felis]
MKVFHLVYTFVLLLSLYTASFTLASGNEGVSSVGIKGLAKERIEHFEKIIKENEEASKTPELKIVRRTKPYIRDFPGDYTKKLARIDHGGVLSEDTMPEKDEDSDDESLSDAFAISKAESSYSEADEQSNIEVGEQGDSDIETSKYPHDLDLDEDLENYHGTGEPTAVEETSEHQDSSGDEKLPEQEEQAIAEVKAEGAEKLSKAQRKKPSALNKKKLKEELKKKKNDEKLRKAEEKKQKALQKEEEKRLKKAEKEKLKALKKQKKDEQKRKKLDIKNQKEQKESKSKKADLESKDEVFPDEEKKRSCCALSSKKSEKSHSTGDLKEKYGQEDLKTRLIEQNVDSDTEDLQDEASTIASENEENFGLDLDEDAESDDVKVERPTGYTLDEQNNEDVTSLDDMTQGDDAVKGDDLSYKESYPSYSNSDSYDNSDEESEAEIRTRQFGGAETDFKTERIPSEDAIFDNDSDYIEDDIQSSTEPSEKFVFGRESQDILSGERAVSPLEEKVEIEGISDVEGEDDLISNDEVENENNRSYQDSNIDLSNDLSYEPSDRDLQSYSDNQGAASTNDGTNAVDEEFLERDSKVGDSSSDGKGKSFFGKIKSFFRRGDSVSCSRTACKMRLSKGKDEPKYTKDFIPKIYLLSRDVPKENFFRVPEIASNLRSESNRLVFAYQLIDGSLLPSSVLAINSKSFIVRRWGKKIQNKLKKLRSEFDSLKARLSSMYHEGVLKGEYEYFIEEMDDLTIMLYLASKEFPKNTQYVSVAKDILRYPEVVSTPGERLLSIFRKSKSCGKRCYKKGGGEDHEVRSDEEKAIIKGLKKRMKFIRKRYSAL